MDGAFSLAGTRVPPANLEAEQALLGALLANNKAYDRCAEFLRPDHFADPAHALIYGAIQRRIESGGVADPVSIRAEFENNGTLADAGGPGYLGKLLGAFVGIINAGEYARVIEDAWLRRQLLGLGETIVNRAYGSEPELRARDMIEMADTALLAIADQRSAEGMRDGHAVARGVEADMMAAIERRGALAGVTYGFRGLDRMTGGMRPAQFILLGARPSMGKTALALNVALAAAGWTGPDTAPVPGQRVYFVCAEMTAEEVMKRAVANAAGVPLSVLTRGGLVDPNLGRWRQAGAPEVDSVGAAAQVIGGLPIVWDDGAFTVAAIRARARRLQRQPGGLGLVVVDYLSRIRPSAEAARNGSVAVATELSRGFKDLAMQLGVPVLLLSQLNRQVEGRDDKQPVMSDLRDSGALEQDADVVLFLHRAHYYLARSEPKRTPKERAADFDARVQAWEQDMARERGKATISIAKQRQGPIGPVRVLFDDETAQFRDEPAGQGGD